MESGSIGTGPQLPISLTAPPPVTCLSQTRGVFLRFHTFVHVISAPSLLIHLSLAPNLHSKITSSTLSSLTCSVMLNMHCCGPVRLQTLSSAHPSLAHLHSATQMASAMTRSSVRTRTMSQTSCIPSVDTGQSMLWTEGEGKGGGITLQSHWHKCFGHRISLRGPHWKGDIKRYAQTICDFLNLPEIWISG